VADLQINIKGDSSGGVKAFDDVGAAARGTEKDAESTKKAWQALGAGIAAAAAAALAFAVASVKAFADSEKVQRQLTRAAGEYSAALSDQAEALSKLYAVDDDIIKQSTILLTQWGGSAAASEKTTKAILDYAQATGQDAVSATQDLIRNVESGGAGLAKMGVHFTATGDKGKDLDAAVTALGKKFGGAGGAYASSLAGQAESATLAFEDFQKAFGQMVAELLSKDGVVVKLTASIRELTQELFTPAAAKKAQSQDYVRQQLKMWEDAASGKVEVFKDVANGIKVSFEEAQENVAKWSALLVTDGKDKNVTTGPRVDGTTNKGLKDREAAAAAAKAHAKEMADISDKNAEMMRQSMRDQDTVDAHAEAARAKEVDSFWKVVDEEQKAEAQREANDLEFRRRMAQQVDKGNADIEAAEQASLNKAIHASNEANRKRIADAKSVADQIGAAFVDGLANQLAKLAEGGEFDVAMFIGDVLAAAFAIAATAIGTAYGQTALGSAVGNLGAMGIRAGASGISKANKKTKTYHEGGWVGDEAELPRYHSGAWIGGDEQRAILQTGERVLSRKEVGAMGGSSGVDAAASGGGPRFNFTIQAMDGLSIRQFFEGDGGRGFYNALRTGRGSLTQAIGGI
jgi:hypothetical protein